MDRCHVTHFTRGGHTFEIVRTADRTGYVGLYDGAPSVRADEKGRACRALLEKHVGGLRFASTQGSA